ncbi:MAG: hypothetical protein EOP56_17425 [Sphingobacteriales bacterium]|nr:MAG: hypothetical protein EOP56_17425 [Sphingobacteriales bacterium]
MKKILFLSAIAFSSYNTEAKIALSLEAGAGFGIAGSRYEVNNLFYSGQTILDAQRTVRPVLGATLSYSKHRMFFGIGVRYWTAASKFSDFSLYDLKGAPVATSEMVNTVNSISIPLHAGFHFPVKKLFVEAKVKAGPSIVKQELSVKQTNGDLNLSNVDNNLLFVGGADLSIGTRIAPRTQLQLKYSFMSYLADVEYDRIPPASMPFRGALWSDKPNMHAIMLEASFAL